MTAKKIFTRNFILGFLAQFTFSTAFQILIPVLPIYLSKRGSTEEEIGILIGVFSVSSLVLRPFVGKSLLKTPEKNFMGAGSLLLVLTSLGFLLFPPFWPFFVVRVLQGVGLAFFYTASFTFITNISSGTHLGQSFSYYHLSVNIASVLGPSSGMFLANHFSFTIVFLVCAFLSLLSLTLTTRLKRRWNDLVEDSSVSVTSFFSRKALPPSIIAFFGHIIWGALIAFFPLYALNHGVSNPGIFFAVFAIMLILGRGLGGRILDMYRREELILPCLAGFIIAMIVLTLSKSLPMFILTAVIWGSANAFLFPTLVAYAVDLAGPSRGLAMGTFTAAADLGTGLGSVIMGLILRYTSYQAMFSCLVLVSIINLLYFNFFVRRKRKG